MSERKGIFTPEQEEFLAKVLDDFFKFKNKLYEQFDKATFRLILRVSDDSTLDNISSQWKLKLIPIVDEAIKGNIDEVRKYVTDLLNEKIDIPKLDEEQELMVFDAFTKFLAVSIDYYINKKKIN